jgi:hypothetical protein
MIRQSHRAVLVAIVLAVVLASAPSPPSDIAISLTIPSDVQAYSRANITLVISNPEGERCNASYYVKLSDVDTKKELLRPIEHKESLHGNVVRTALPLLVRAGSYRVYAALSCRTSNGTVRRSSTRTMEVVPQGLRVSAGRADDLGTIPVPAAVGRLVLRFAEVITDSEGTIAWSRPLNVSVTLDGDSVPLGNDGTTVLTITAGRHVLSVDGMKEEVTIPPGETVRHVMEIPSTLGLVRGQLVERVMDGDTVVWSQMLAARTVYIYRGAVLAATTETDDEGRFLAVLPPGRYDVYASPLS